MASRGGVNKRQLEAEISRQGRSFLVKEADRIVSSIQKDAEGVLLNNFNAHPITREIENEGELFAFVGFVKGDNPIEKVRHNLRVLINRVSFGRNQLSIRYRIQIPSLEDFQDPRFSLPWADGRSWVSAIEKGLPNYGRFVRKAGLGRSEGGILFKQKLSSQKYSARKYLSSIFNLTLNYVRGRINSA